MEKTLDSSPGFFLHLSFHRTINHIIGSQLVLVIDSMVDDLKL